MYMLFVLAPLLVGGTAALLLGLKAGAERYSKYAALAGTLLSSLLVLMLLLSPGPSASVQWFSFQQYQFQLSLAIQPLNQMLLALVAIISPLVFLYSIGYMEVPSEQGRFYFEMSLFAASMALLAMSGGFITMFIAWEGLGVTSYLLIGFWYRKNAPPQAARKAITTILIGDISMLAGMLLLYGYFGSFSFSSIASSAASVPAAILLVPLSLIIIAAFTKSAQFPFHEWLSDAMEGPTPVSAYLHSSTMVKAGVFVVALLFPVFLAAHLLAPLLIIGLATTAIGALNALSSSHLKKVLAYSTIEDLGLMFVALGLNALPAAIVLFVVQAFYKALLFMSAGSIMKANNGETDIYRVTAYGRNRLLFAVALIGALSLAGIFPLSGFFGKVLVDQSATGNAIVYMVLTAADFLTGFYIFRWLFLPISNQKQAKTQAQYRYTSRSMLAPQVVLAVLVVAATAYMLFYVSGLHIGINVAFIETLAAVIGLVMAYIVIASPSRNAWKSSSIRVFLANGFFVNTFYTYLSKLALAFARAVELFDGWLNRIFYAGGDGIINSGKSLGFVERGNVNVYIAASAAGLVFIMLVLVLIA